MHLGVKGFVYADSGRPIPGARVRVEGRDHVVTTAADGDYWRLLVAGQYQVSVSADGYDTNTTSVTVGEGEAVTMNFTLVAIGGTGPLRASWLAVGTLLAVIGSISGKF